MNMITSLNMQMYAWTTLAQELLWEGETEEVENVGDDDLTRRVIGPAPSDHRVGKMILRKD